MNHAINFSPDFGAESAALRQGIMLFGRISRLRERLSPSRLSFHSQFPPNKFLFCSLAREIFLSFGAIENCVGLHARVGQLYTFYDCRSALTVFTASPILERGKRYFFTSNLIRSFVLGFSFAFAAFFLWGELAISFKLRTAVKNSPGEFGERLLFLSFFFRSLCNTFSRLLLTPKWTRCEARCLIV